MLVDDNSGVLTKYLNGDGIDNKLRVQTGNDVKYFLADHLGSTNGLADSSGNITSSASYDSFGNATGNLNTRYQFTGREFDNFTGLHYYRARWYDGNLGRFISEDPIGFGGGDVNFYGYVWNSPNGFTDPMGHDGWGNDFADWSDDRIETARQFYEPDPDAVNWNTGVNFVSNLAHGTADLFRIGNGVAQAYYCEDTIWGQLAFIAMDIGRGSGIASTVLGATAPRFSSTPSWAKPFVRANPNVRNGHLAGKTHPKTGVPFDSGGFPEFSNNLYRGGVSDVTIKPTGIRTSDFAAANKAAGYSSTPKGYTWHHHQTPGRMQLVERTIHSKTGHTGGFSLW